MFFEKISIEFKDFSTQLGLEQLWQKYTANTSIDSLIEVLKMLDHLTDRIKIKNASTELFQYIYTCFNDEIDKYEINQSYNLAKLLVEKVNFKLHIALINKQIKVLVYKIGQENITYTSARILDKAAILFGYPNEQPWLFFKTHKKSTGFVLANLVAVTFYQSNQWLMKTHDTRAEITLFTLQLFLILLSTGYGYLKGTKALDSFSDREKYQILLTQVEELKIKLDTVEQKVKLYPSIDSITFNF